MPKKKRKIKTLPNNPLVKEVIKRKIIKCFGCKDNNRNAAYWKLRDAAKAVIREYELWIIHK